MIQKEWLWRIWLQSGIKLVIFLIIQIKLAPEEIWRSDGIFLTSLGPITTSFQTIDDMFRAIAFPNSESVVFETNVRVFRGLRFCTSGIWCLFLKWRWKNHLWWCSRCTFLLFLRSRILFGGLGVFGLNFFLRSDLWLNYCRQCRWLFFDGGGHHRGFSFFVYHYWIDWFWI